MPTTFIKNKKYFLVGCPDNELKRDGAKKRRQELMENYWPTIKSNKSFTALKEPVLDFFMFHRIVIDEAHQVLNDALTAGTIRIIEKY